MDTKTFQVLVEQDEDGVYVAEVPGIPACYAQGRTYEEAIENIRDVLEMCIEEMKSRGEEIPFQSEIIGIKRLEIAV
ncbi:MAG: type II toxin-antitoxin system HicB family antitoxin [Planctomycetes bacterium]|nr:type II toxin-antitoxin system HicB family antitoxin [Planctomycetota bacterium]